jgi:hypothetical protein
MLRQVAGLSNWNVTLPADLAHWFVTIDQNLQEQLLPPGAGALPFQLREQKGASHLALQRTGQFQAIGSPGNQPGRCSDWWMKAGVFRAEWSAPSTG